MIERLKQKWGIESTLQVVLILVVFSVTGSLAVKLARPVLAFLGITRDTMSLWQYIPLRILIIFPIYQMLLLVVAFIFGQFNFFLTFQKKMLRRMRILPQEK